MTITRDEYFSIRSDLLKDNQSYLLTVEQYYMQFLVKTTLSVVDSIYRDFGYTKELYPFWNNYPPRQRGRSPTGQSIPWGEVGEKTVGLWLARAIAKGEPSITYPGLPLGGDIRFATGDALIHLDLKLTGPNDNPHEIVASPHQVSGDGLLWENDGVKNSPVVAYGKKATMDFQPELPPFYLLEARVRICLTYFVKAIYTVQSFNEQPLDYLELVCIPNGLLLFDGPVYASTKGLLIPGKDEKHYAKKRARFRLDPLANLAAWRCVKILYQDGQWKAINRKKVSI